MDVDHLKIEIKTSELPSDTLKLIKHIRADWKPEEVQFKIFTDGITNKLIGCFSVVNPNDILLVRVYGDKTDLFIDRKAEIESFKLMNSKGYAPKLYATFENGMIYDFIPGDILNAETCRDPSIYPLVASMMAKMHKLGHNGHTRKPIVWDKCTCFIDLIPETYSDSDKQIRFISYFAGGRQSLQRELIESKVALETAKNPVVFCHNDLLLANVIHNDSSVVFIDYEYAGYNYQAFDIANHFAEFAGVSEFDHTLFPSVEFQLEWLKYYLDEYSDCEQPVQEADVQRLYSDVCKFVPLAHFMWSVWSLVQFQHSNIDFDYLKYAVARFGEYMRMKENMYHD